MIAYGSDPLRHYHATSHIESMWDSLDSIMADGGSELFNISHEDLLVLCFAILYHDIVYDPRSEHSKNELDSIGLWEKFSAAAGFPLQLMLNVSTLIRCTISHSIPEPPFPHILPVFLDLDLQVLGESAEQYNIYCRNIRKEYAHYPADDYRSGRVKVLRRLSAGEIYFTDYFKSRYQARARENMEWEIGQLLDGVSFD